MQQIKQISVDIEDWAVARSRFSNMSKLLRELLRIRLQIPDDIPGLETADKLKKMYILQKAKAQELQNQLDELQKSKPLGDPGKAVLKDDWSEKG